MAMSQAVLREDAARAGRAAGSSAQFAHSLWGLIHAGASLPQALDAIAAQRRAGRDPAAPIYARIAYNIRGNGVTLHEALQAERPFFSSRLVAALALGDLSGFLFKTFVRHLDEQARYFSGLPPETAAEFPIVADEFREFFFYLGHLLVQRADPAAVQRWMPIMFSTVFRGDIAYVLLRFFEKGLRLSEALRVSRCFQDEEIIVQIEAAENLSMLGPILLEIPEWLDQRQRLEEQLRYLDMLGIDRPPAPKA
jgi:type II secretory pathway component PulF